MRFSIACLVSLILAAGSAAAQEGEVYRHPDGYFEILRPEGWSVRHTYNGMEFQAVLHPGDASDGDPETAFRILFIPLADGVEPGPLEAKIPALARQVVDGILKPGKGGRTLGEEAIRIANRPGHRIDLVQVNDSGVELRGRVLGTVGKAVFFLIYYAPAARWAQVEPVFAAMVDSFAHRQPILARVEPSERTAAYEDPEGAFAIDRPENWIPQLTQEEGAIRYHFVPKRSVQDGEEPEVLFMVQYFDVPGGVDASLTQSARDLKGNLTGRDENLRFVSESPVRIGDRAAIRMRFDLEGPRPLREDVYVTTKGSRVFVLFGVAPAGEFAANEAAFERTARSLRIP